MEQQYEKLVESSSLFGLDPPKKYPLTKCFEELCLIKVNAL